MFCGGKPGQSAAPHACTQPCSRRRRGLQALAATRAPILGCTSNPGPPGPAQRAAAGEHAEWEGGCAGSTHSLLHPYYRELKEGELGELGPVGCATQLPGSKRKQEYRLQEAIAPSKALFVCI